MKKSTRRIALALSVFMCLQPVMYSSTDIYSEITALELEIVKMETKVGDYSKMSDDEIEAKKAKTKKTLEKKKAKAKKQFEKDKKTIKKGAKEAGKDLKKAGQDIGHTFRDIFSD